MSERATEHRAAEIREEAAAIALRLAELAEGLLHASNRVRDASMQAHFEAISQVYNAQKQLADLETRIRTNNLRWSDAA